MSIVILIGCILFLVLLITSFKINPFIAFIVTSLLAGLLLGLPVMTITQTVQKGMGDMLGAVTLIIVLGACIGKLTSTSGAATVIANSIMKKTGKKYVRTGLMITGFIVGIPLFYSVGFVLLVPLIFSVAYQFKLPRVYIAIPMLASLSVAHGFLPPHPSPMALTKMLNADLGLVLIYGFIISIPTILIAGLFFSNFLKNIKSLPGESAFSFSETSVSADQQPSFTVSILSSLFPVFLLSATSIIPFIIKNQDVKVACEIIGDPVIAMLISLILCTYTLGLKLGKNMKSIMEDYGSAIKEIALILLIIGGAGSLKEVMMVSGVSQDIVDYFLQVNIHPYLLAWLITAIVRVSIGSATAAGLMTASVLLPLLGNHSVDPNLLVLSIGAGSLMCSHVNDPGFWMFKEYFNVSLKDTFKSWTLMESFVSILGIVFVFILNIFIH